MKIGKTISWLFITLLNLILFPLFNFINFIDYLTWLFQFNFYIKKGDYLKYLPFDFVATMLYKVDPKTKVTVQVKSPIDGEIVYKRKSLPSVDKMTILNVDKKRVRTLGDFFKWCCSRENFMGKVKNQRCFGYRIPIEKKVVKKKEEKDGKIIEVDWEVMVFQDKNKGGVKFLTYETVDKYIDYINSSLHHLINLKKGSKLGFIEDTCKEWILMAHSSFRAGIVPVTGYTALGIEGIFSLLNENKIPSLFTNFEKLKSFKENKIHKRVPSLKWIIYNKIEYLKENKENKIENEKILKEFEKETNIKLISFSDLIKIGKELNEKNEKNQKNEKNGKEEKEEKEKKEGFSDEIAMIMYTSGTSSEPKGVPLTHKNVLSSINEIGEALGHIPNIEYRFLGYLPLCHIYEFVVQHYVFLRTGTICFGSPRTLSALSGGVEPSGDIATFAPMGMTGVPRVFNTIKKGLYQKIRDSNFILQLLFKTAYRFKKNAIYSRNTPIWDALVFNKIKNKMGGNLKAFISGGAPLSKSTHEFLRIVFGATTIQGYGLTETCAVSLVQSAVRKIYFENSGSPTHAVEMKFCDCPELGYCSTKNKKCGEICLRGDSVFKGYHNKPELNKDVFSGKNNKYKWFHTGDIGIELENGAIQIIDRKKNISKLSNGEYISLELLESSMNESPMVDVNGVIIICNSQKDHYIAIVQPNVKYLKKWMPLHSMKFTNLHDVCKNEKVKSAILKSLQSCLIKDKFSNKSIVKDIILVSDKFTPENNLLTPSLKFKRRNISLKFKKQIDKIY